MNANQTIAQQLIDQYKQGAELSNACAEASLDQDQDWENETTTHTFSDGSKVKDCGGQVELI